MKGRLSAVWETDAGQGSIYVVRFTDRVIALGRLSSGGRAWATRYEVDVTDNSFAILHDSI
jgi:hypothetical protein